MTCEGAGQAVNSKKANGCREAVELADTTDFGWRGDQHMDLAEVLQLGGKQEEAVRAAERALELYEQKGNAWGTETRSGR